MVGFFSSLIRKQVNKWKWSIDKATQQVLDIEGVYDVMYEPSTPGRYLLHVWATSPEKVEKRLREVLRKRPRRIKIDVLLYRREVE
jgi:hypothetical protein